MTRNGRSGVTSAISGIRLLLRNPLFRLAIKPLSKEICINGEKRKVAYEALRLIVEDTSETCLVARFYAKMLEILFNAAIKYFNGNKIYNSTNKTVLKTYRYVEKVWKNIKHKRAVSLNCFVS